MISDDSFRIELPLRRSVRWDDYMPAAAVAFLDGRSWPSFIESYRLIKAAKGDPFFRRHVVAVMRNAMWRIRNHRNVAIPVAVAAVSIYSASERLLELAGVRPVVLSLLCDFLLCECNCKGACSAMDFDLTDVEQMPAPCDHVVRRLHELVHGGVCSEKLIIDRLTEGSAAPFTGALSARGGAAVPVAQVETRRASSASRFIVGLRAGFVDLHEVLSLEEVSELILTDDRRL